MVFHLFSSSITSSGLTRLISPFLQISPALIMAPKRKVPSTEVEISGPTSTRPKISPKAPVEVAAEPIRSRPKFKVELVVDSKKDPSWVLDEPIADSEARTTWPERYQVIQVYAQIYTFTLSLNFWNWWNFIFSVEEGSRTFTEEEKEKVNSRILLLLVAG